MAYCDECGIQVMHNSPPLDGVRHQHHCHVVTIGTPPTENNKKHIVEQHPHHGNASSKNDNSNSNNNNKELPRIPVAMRHPYMIASVRQYRSDAQQLQLQQHIISESFVPVIPYSVDRPARKRRRPPFSCSSLIIQAISTSETGQMTLQDIYKWILDKYPSLYNEEDTGWQNTIRHNLSLNKYFKKIPKSGSSRGKGGFWTLDSKYLEDEGQGIKNRRTTPNNHHSNTRPEQASPSSPITALSSISSSTTTTPPPPLPSHKKSSSSSISLSCPLVSRQPPPSASSSQQQPSRLLQPLVSPSSPSPSPLIHSSTSYMKSHCTSSSLISSSSPSSSSPSSTTTTTTTTTIMTTSTAPSNSKEISTSPSFHVMDIQSILN